MSSAAEKLLRAVGCGISKSWPLCLPLRCVGPTCYPVQLKELIHLCPQLCNLWMPIIIGHEIVHPSLELEPAESWLIFHCSASQVPLYLSNPSDSLAAAQIFDMIMKGVTSRRHHGKVQSCGAAS